jgi:hypothetical protein
LQIREDEGLSVATTTFRSQSKIQKFLGQRYVRFEILLIEGQCLTGPKSNAAGWRRNAGKLRLNEPASLSDRREVLVSNVIQYPHFFSLIQKSGDFWDSAPCFFRFYL